MSSEFGDKPLAQMIQSYFVNLGPDGEWSNETLHDRASDFKQLVKIGESVPCQAPQRYSRDTSSLGLRSAELRILTADNRVAMQGRGNLVNFDSGEVYVRFQMGRFTNKLPKGSKQRDVVIPQVSKIATKIDVRDFLTKRCAAALVEQGNGTNPDALIFPNPYGQVWDASVHRRRSITVLPIYKTVDERSRSSHQKILLRVCMNFHGKKLVLLLHGYDKGI
jgi:hypothetical protein